MKKSTCFSKQVNKQRHDLDTTHASLTLELSFPNCSKELDSTFGEENVLAFRQKPPKRKRNIRNPQQRYKNEEASESSDSNSSATHSQRFHKKAAETFKSLLQLPRPRPSGFEIGDFVVLGKIGEGTYSEVFKAMERRSGFVCALKVLEKQKMRKMSVHENVVREIKIHMFLEHPNIAKLYGCFHDATRIFLIEEYCTDSNLYKAMK